MKKILLLLFAFYSSIIYSQTDHSFIYSSEEIIKKGVQLFEEKKYEDAIIEYQKISKFDPKYLTAQYEIALTLSTMDKSEELKTFFEKLHQDKSMEEMPELYVLYGSFLSNLKEYDASEKIFLECEKFIPNSSNFLYNFAILTIRKENTQKGVDLLKKIIEINPNHASSHYLLGLLALENGKITEGTFALMSYLLLAPNGKFAENALLKLNEKFGQNYLTKSNIVFSASGDNFEEIETILRNQLPLKSAYTIKSQIDDVAIRQIQAVAEYTLEHKIGDGFFETIYIPWIKSMIEKNQFEGYSYYILESFEGKIGKQIKKQSGKIKSFYESYLVQGFWEKFATRKTDLFGKEVNALILLNSGDPYLIGVQVDGKSEGKHKLLNKNGNCVGELNYKNDLLDGVQKYFDDKGNNTEQKTYANGKLEGERIMYFSNGAVSFIENYKDDIVQDITTYYANGGVQCTMKFANGNREGKLVCLYPNGEKKSEITYTNGELNGPFIKYNEQGDIVDSNFYLNGKLNGIQREYFDGKKIKSEATYNEGKIQGAFKRYYPNQILERENNYVNGKLTSNTDYYSNGKKMSESNYDSNENLENYRYFDSNETNYFEEKYNSGEIKTGYQFLKNISKPIAITISKNPFVINTIEGNKLVEGEFLKGKKTNEWNYYFSSGNLKLKENYSQGLLNGKTSYYYKNGLQNFICNYQNDTIKGVYEVFENGKLNRLFHYDKGERNGPFKTFYPDGTLSMEGFYVEDELNFEKINYWQNGKIARRENYIDNVLIKSISYTTDGELENIIDYKNRTGTFSVAYNKGTIIQQYEMKNGELNGLFSLKDKLNNPIMECEFRNGIRTNQYKSYSPYGTLYTESNYYAGKLHNTDKQYDVVGNLRLTDENCFGNEYGKTTRFYYNKAKLFDYTKSDGLYEGDYSYYNQKGEKILTIGYKNNAASYYIPYPTTENENKKIEIIEETAVIKATYPNGTIAIQLELKKGNLEGRLLIASENGQPEFEANYKNSLLEGERIEYYTNKRIYRKERFKEGNYEGKQEYFKEDGKPWVNLTYKNDELHGDTKIYTDGKLIVTKKYDSNELVEISK